MPKTIFSCCLLLIAGLLASSSAGCAAAPSLPTPAALPTSTRVAAIVTPVGDDLERYFQGFDGAFVLVDQNGDASIRYRPQRCTGRRLPASTFKILNSLISLETGVVPDENTVFPWGGTQYDDPAWNQDHTMRSAIRDSVVWYYQELARRVGRERMQQYVDGVGYGNQDISGPIDAFWLVGGLRISADEQVEFLKRLYRDDLPFSQRSLDIVKDILLQEQGDAYRLSGKTGSGVVEGVRVGWFVGYLEKQGNVYFFAANITGPGPDGTGLKAREIVLDILRAYCYLP